MKIEIETHTHTHMYIYIYAYIYIYRHTWANPLCLRDALGVGKGELLQKETHNSVKRDLLHSVTEKSKTLLTEKRPTIVSKETHYSVKRDLH
jgi:hypothetical protein